MSIRVVGSQPAIPAPHRGRDLEGGPLLPIRAAVVTAAFVFVAGLSTATAIGRSLKLPATRIRCSRWMDRTRRTRGSVAAVVFATTLVVAVSGGASLASAAVRGRPAIVGQTRPKGGSGAPLSTCPPGATDVKPSQDLANVVSGSPLGTTFCLEPGTYRVATPIGTKSGDTFIGSGMGVTFVRGDITIPGSRWSQSGGLWTDSSKDALPSPLLDTTPCADGTKVCDYEDDLNRGDSGVPLKRVLVPCSTKNVVAGTYCIDYSKRTIYMADNPSTLGGVTYTVDPSGFGSASNSLISDITIAHVASTGVSIGTGSTGTRLEVEFVHEAGTILSSNSTKQPATLTDSHLHDNGLKGGGGPTSSGVFSYNEVDHNGWAGFDGSQGVSGAKFSTANNLTVRGNGFHDNIGSGLWMDVQTENFTVTDNVMANNHISIRLPYAIRGGYGILIEHSCHLVFQNNTISGNDRSAINATNPTDVSISGNTISGNGRGIELGENGRAQPAGPCIRGGGVIAMKNIVVRNNDITMSAGYSGFILQGKPLDPTDSFNGNTYHVADCGGHWWVLGRVRNLLTWSAWRAAGEDSGGTCGK